MNEPNEFRIMYRVPTLEDPGPWIHSIVDNMDEAIKDLSFLNKWLTDIKYPADAWIESRHVGPWTLWGYS